MTDLYEFHAEIFIFDRFYAGRNCIDWSNKLSIENNRNDDCTDDENFCQQEKVDLALQQKKRKDNEYNVDQSDEKDIFSS